MKLTPTSVLGSLVACWMIWGAPAGADDAAVQDDGPSAPIVIQNNHGSPSVLPSGGPDSGYSGSGHYGGRAGGYVIPGGESIGMPVPVPFGPWVGFDARWGSGPGWMNDFYRANVFIPMHIDPGENLLFTAINLGVTDDGNGLLNLGQGYRTYSSAMDRVFGASVWYDLDDGHARHYHRLGASFETLGRYFDFRLNGYVVLPRGSRTLQDVFVGDPFFAGNFLFMTRHRFLETAFHGVDAETGGLMPFIGRYGFSGYAGAYYLAPHRSEFFRDTAGVKLRLESQVTEDVTVGVQYTYDDLFRDNLLVHLALTLPDGKPTRWFRPRPVRERLAVPVERDYRIATHRTQGITDEVARDPQTGRPITFAHIDEDAVNGDGTFENPFSPGSFVNSPFYNVLLVSGQNLVFNDTIALFNNQRLLGTGVIHVVNTQWGPVVLPGTGTGITPFLFNAQGGTVIQLANNNEVSGVGVDGSGTGDGIVGANFANFNLNRSIVRNSLTGIDLINASGLVQFDGNVIGNNALDGTRITNTNAPLLTLLAQRNAWFGNGGSGLHLAAFNSNVNAQIGGPSPLDGNAFFTNEGTAGVFFDLTGNSVVNLDAQNNGAVVLADEGPVIREGFDDNELARNDDLSTGLEPIGFLIDFFGVQYTDLFVNNNGNVTFAAPLGVFTPFPILATGVPMIAPFFADVDTRFHGEAVTYGQGMVGNQMAFGVNWLDVDYFFSSPAHADQLNSFQLVIIDRSDIAPGDFDFEFNYAQVLWETGDASGGTNGLGGFSARAGFSNGVNTAFELPGSAIPGSFLDGGPLSLAANSLNSTLPGRYRFQVRSGAVGAGNDGDGFRIELDDTAVLATANFINNTISSNGMNGLAILASGNSQVTLANIQGNLLNDNGLHGLLLRAQDNAFINTLVAGNQITNNGGNGIRVETSGNGTVQGSIANNLIQDNGDDGIAFVTNPGGTIDFGNLAAGRSISGNTITDNDGSGVFLQAEDAFVNLRLTGNLIAGNNGFGVFADTTDTVLNLTVGGPAFADGNDIFNAVGAGIAVTTRTLFAGQTASNITIQNNLIDGTTAGLGVFDGDGIRIERLGNTLLNGVVSDNVITNNAGDGLDVIVRGLDPLNVNDPNTWNRLTFNDNFISQSGGHGVSFQVETDAVLLANGARNTVLDSGLHGVRVSTTQDAFFGDPRVAPTVRSVFDGFQIAGSGLDGINITSDAATNRVFLDISSSTRETIVADSGGDGIHLDLTASGGNQSDVRIGGGGFVTTISGNGTGAAGGNGVRLDAGDTSAPNLTILDAFIADNLAVAGQNGHGVLINVSGTASPTVTIENTTIRDNEGDGVQVVVAGPTTDADGPGIDFNFLGSTAALNDGRGIAILLSGASGPAAGRDPAAYAPQALNFTIGALGGQQSFLVGNNLEGLYFEADAGFINNRFEDFPLNTLDPPGGPWDPDQPLLTALPEYAPGDPVGAPDPAQFAGGYYNTAADLVANLTISNTRIQFNGDDGVYLRVGKNTLLTAVVTNNEMGGNGLSDFRTDSINSAPNPSNSNQAGGTDTIFFDDPAQLWLTFAGNTGNLIDVTEFGARYTNNDTFKAFGNIVPTNRNAGFFNVMLGPGNVFNAQPTTIQQAFEDGGYDVTP